MKEIHIKITNAANGFVVFDETNYVPQLMRSFKDNYVAEDLSHLLVVIKDVVERHLGKTQGNEDVKK